MSSLGALGEVASTNKEVSGMGVSQPSVFLSATLSGYNDGWGNRRRSRNARIRLLRIYVIRQTSDYGGRTAGALGPAYSAKPPPDTLRRLGALYYFPFVGMVI